MAFSPSEATSSGSVNLAAWVRVAPVWKRCGLSATVNITISLMFQLLFSRKIYIAWSMSSLSIACLSVLIKNLFLPESLLLFVELPAWSRLALAGTWILQEQTSNQMLNSLMVVLSPQHWQMDVSKIIRNPLPNYCISRKAFQFHCRIGRFCARYIYVC